MKLPALFLSALLLCPLAAAEKPNLLFIFADDHAYNCIASLGNDEIKTPNLDKLVKGGTTVTHAYTQGSWSGAVCIASRTMLVTGLNLWKAEKVYKDVDKEYRQQNKMWPQLLAAGGYDTYFTGKWHIRADAEQSFKVARNVRPGMPKAMPEGYNRPLGPDDKTWLPWDKEMGGFWEGGRHWSAIVADDAKDYLDMAKEKDAPFFMYIAFNAPHDPRQSPEKFVDQYPLEDISLPQPFYEKYEFAEEMASGEKLRDEKLAPYPRTEYAVKVNRQEYYAIITHMDFQIGRILKALEDSGKADKTYIVFTADHGLAVGHHSLMGKQNMFDHSVRVPWIITGPGIPAGKKIDEPIYLQDVMATSFEIAGMEKPAHVDFQSVLPLVRGEAKGLDAVYGAYLDKQRSVTIGSKKLIHYPEAKKTLFFDLENDPLETKAGEPSENDKASLVAAFEKLQKEVGDEMVIDW
ncbi:MAG: sulfatase-like hydrolase/transferase [Verrucomicrobiota bacterium]